MHRPEVNFAILELGLIQAGAVTSDPTQQPVASGPAQTVAPTSIHWNIGTLHNLYVHMHLVDNLLTHNILTLHTTRGLGRNSHSFPHYY